MLMMFIYFTNPKILPRMGGYPSDQTPSRCNGYPIDWMILQVLWISLAIYPAGYHQLIPSGND